MISSLFRRASVAAISLSLSLQGIPLATAQTTPPAPPPARLSYRPLCTEKDVTKCAAYVTSTPTTLHTQPLKVNDIFVVEVIVQRTGTSSTVSKVRSWLTFDPVILEAISAEPSSFFDASTPGEMDVDPITGYVKIQATAKAGADLSPTTLPVAQVKLKVKSGAPAGKTPIAFYDLTGTEPHTAVYLSSDPSKNVVSGTLGTLFATVPSIPVSSVASVAQSSAPEGGTTSSAPASTSSSTQGTQQSSGNVTQTSSQPSANASSGNLDGTSSARAASSTPSATTSSTANASTPGTTGGTAASSLHAVATGTGGNVAPLKTSFVLLQPQNVRVTTEGTSIYLAWDALLSSEIVGYNVYYGTQPGRYIQRKSLDKDTLSLALRSLPPGVTYYLALRGVSITNEESAFSQEVAVTVSRPETSTAPLTQLPPEFVTPDDGPQGQNPLESAPTDTATTVPGESGFSSTMALMLLISAVIGTMFAFRRQFVAVSRHP